MMASTILIAPLMIFLGALIAAIGTGAVLGVSGEQQSLRCSRTTLRAVSFGLPNAR
jgi:hypothetical protein